MLCNLPKITQLATIEIAFSVRLNVIKMCYHITLHKLAQGTEKMCLTTPESSWEWQQEEATC